MSNLTAEEAAWLKKLQRVLGKCPSDRLGFFTIGDPYVSVYDKEYQGQIDNLMDDGKTDFCTAVDKLDAGLATIDFPSHVHATAG